MFHRYYYKNIDSAETEKKKDTIIKKTNEKETSIEQDDEANKSVSSWCKNLEEEQKCKTREFNEQKTHIMLNFGCNIFTFRYFMKYPSYILVINSIVML